MFGRIKADLRLHDGVRVVASSAWEPAHKDAPTVAFAAANVDFTTKTRAATDLTHTFRVLAVLVSRGRRLEDRPDAVVARRPCPLTPTLSAGAGFVR